MTHFETMRFVPPLARFLLLAATVNVVLLGLFRLVFWFWFDNPSDPAPWGELLQAFYLGAKFDLRLTLFVLLPFIILGWFRWLEPFGSPLRRRLWAAVTTMGMALVLLVYFLDFGHYAYLHIRIDNTVLRFLQNADTSAQMVWESYPVIWITLGFAALLYAYYRLTIAMLRMVAASHYEKPRLRFRIVANSLTLLVVLFGFYGKFGWYPLRWSEAFFSTHPFVSAIANNPVLYFYETLKVGGVKYDRDTVVKAYPTIAEFLKLGPRDPQQLDFVRQVDVEPLVKPPNVVLVFLESFAWYKSGLSGNPLDPTPNFDALAQSGLLFDHFYVPHTGTARSVFTTLTGIPDVQLNETASRNPSIVNQHTIVNAFTDYEKYYFLGGSANWGNIRGVLTNNIPGLQVYEEGSYQSPRLDVWGISDLDLFREADQVLATSNKPFFAIIQTSGNHRPYTIPDNNAGFELTHPGQNAARRFGFESEEEFNSFRFMDHSIGHFMELAQTSSYFDNTLFVFFGDHGIAGDAGEHMPKTEGQLDLGAHRTPFLLYGPSIIGNPSRNPTIGSHLDILPTVAAVTGHSYTNTTLGRNLLDERFADVRYAFTITHKSVPRIGLIDRDWFLTLRGDDVSLHRQGNTEPRADFSSQQPERTERMARFARALYETSRYMLNHNERLTDETSRANSRGETTE